MLFGSELFESIIGELRSATAIKVQYPSSFDIHCTTLMFTTALHCLDMHYCTALHYLVLLSTFSSLV
jgi:hypothetical protein